MQLTQPAGTSRLSRRAVSSSYQGGSGPVERVHSTKFFTFSNTLSGSLSFNCLRQAHLRS
jgi:hypothetical protein